MDMDLNTIAKRLPVWELRVTYGDRTFATRRPSFAQLHKLAAFNTLTPDAANELLLSLFQGETPDRGGLAA